MPAPLPLEKLEESLSKISDLGSRVEKLASENVNLRAQIADLAPELRSWRLRMLTPPSDMDRFRECTRHDHEI